MHSWAFGLLVFLLNCVRTRNCLKTNSFTVVHVRETYKASTQTYNKNYKWKRELIAGRLGTWHAMYAIYVIFKCLLMARMVKLIKKELHVLSFSVFLTKGSEFAWLGVHLAPAGNYTIWCTIPIFKDHSEIICAFFLVGIQIIQFTILFAIRYTFCHNSGQALHLHLDQCKRNGNFSRQTVN